jgi:hypothetical protein
MCKRGAGPGAARVAPRAHALRAASAVPVLARVDMCQRRRREVRGVASGRRGMTVAAGAARSPMTPSRLAAAILAIAACHPPTPPRTVSETPARAPVQDDPAVRGDWAHAVTLPDGAAPEAEAVRDFPAYASVHDERFELAPRGARDVPVSLTGAALVVAQAIALRATTPIELAIQRDGSAVATATAIALPPDRSEAAIGAAVDGRGAVSVHVANAGAAPVSVTLVIEIAPRGGR